MATDSAELDWRKEGVLLHTGKQDIFKKGDSKIHNLIHFNDQIWNSTDWLNELNEVNGV